MIEKLIATNREDGGRLAKEAQVKWLRTQEGFQHSRITPWEELPEECKEEWRCIWEGIATPYMDVISSIREGISSLSEAVDMLRLLEIEEESK
jgi:hypothetical protein